MKEKVTSLFVVITLLLSQTSFVFAQTLDAAMPTTETTPDTSATTEPPPATDTATTTDSISSPQADTVPPGFVSIVSASAQDSQANIVWTTDELAYGYVQYGQTKSYGLSTPKSATAALDHSVSISNLTPGSVYHYRIVAEDESGNIAYSKDRILETAAEIVAIDNVAPEITQIDISGITTSLATIHWVTNELAQGRVEYGKTAEYGLATPMSSDYATDHSVALSDLEASTEYHFRIVAQDESGNEAVSPDEVFITDAVAPKTEPAPETESPPPASAPETTTNAATSTTATPITDSTNTPAPSEATPDAGATTATTPLGISHVETSSVSTSTATIIWNTNKPSSSQVLYGPGETYGFSTPLSSSLSTSHTIKLSGLHSGTNYFYSVVSKSVLGETTNENGFEFNTLYEQKIVTLAPTISDVAVESVGPTTATIVFTTDMAATGKINYGTTTGYEETDGGHTTFLTNHSHPLSGLLPGTFYNFEAVVQDASGSETVYKNVTFTTLPKTSTEQPTPAPAPSPVPPPTPPSASPLTGLIGSPQVSSGSSSGGGGIGYYSAPSLKVVGKPAVTKVEPLDSQVLFIWQAALPSSGLKTAIVRNENGYALSPSQGILLYNGNSGRFADTNLQNGKKYYYSVFRTNQVGAYSSPLHFTVAPKQNKAQGNIVATPSVVQKTPIYTFSQKLSRGDRNKQVEHLQVLLASQSSIYPKGLITGYFGPLTEGAVQTFQKRYKLAATGVANAATLKKLEQFSRIEVAKDRASIYDAALPRDLALGMSGPDVSVLQQFLINAQVYPEALVTGYFGRLTQSAVQRFQQEQNITPTYGYFGPITKKRTLNLIRLRSVSF